MRILVLDPDPATRTLQEDLKAQEFEVHWCVDMDDALEAHSIVPFDAIILETLLGQVDGLVFLKALRANGDPTPVLFYSHRGQTEDRVGGLEAGADDYLPKPSARLEILARLRAILRRGSLQKALPEKVSLGDLDWHPAQRKVFRAGQRLDLTPKEYALAALLLKNFGKVVDRETIARVLWGANGVSDANSVDVQVRRLRKKLDEPFAHRLIHTLRGEGVMLGLNT
jgi:two-component system copper resistance phosphate regulon response regulator CusR